MTDPLPRRIAWFAPWTWKRRWAAWKRWTLLVVLLLVGYAESIVIVIPIKERLRPASITASRIDTAIMSVYRPHNWLAAYSDAAYEFFRWQILAIDTALKTAGWPCDSHFMRVLRDPS